MADKPIIHVRVTAPIDDDGLQEIRNEFENSQLAERYEIVTSGKDVDIHELPALDEYTNELADKLVGRMAQHMDIEIDGRELAEAVRDSARDD